MSMTNLSRAGRGRTSTPRIYVGCIPCGKGRHVADLEHANRWIESHWTVCSRTEILSRSEALSRHAGGELDPEVLPAASTAQSGVRP
jgi:hypothetical protein